MRIAERIPQRKSGGGVVQPAFGYAAYVRIVGRRTRSRFFVLVLVALASGRICAEDAPTPVPPPDEAPESPLAETSVPVEPPAPEVAPEPRSVPDDATLEAEGAVIGKITIHAANIFDTEDPKENKKVLRGANHLHRRTRDHVILQQLTFAEGDRYSRAALDESERHLRHNGYLYDAEIRPVAYDGTTVDIDVHTRDVWTLRPAIGFHRSGGVNAVHFGIRDANFLGLGKSVEVERINGVDRTQTLADYLDPGIAGSHVRFHVGYSNNSDGSSAAIGFERPFWRLTESWGGGIRGETTDRTDSLYALGEITNQFQERWTFGNVYYGRLLASSGRTTRRLMVGVTYDQSLFTPLATADPLTPHPPDRTLSYPWVGVSLLHDGFVRAHDMDKIGRTEDVNLGLDFSAKLGFAAPAFGADRTAAVADLHWHNGFNPGWGQIVTLDASAKGRVTSGGVEDGQLDISTRYYHRSSDFRLFFIGLSASAVANLDPDHQLLLGGDNGLRGYPLRYAFGEKSILLTVEQRFFLDREFFHVMRLGGAVFADVGKAWGEMPSPAAHLGVLKDIGFGLRFGQTRSAHAAMLKVDFAIPFDVLGGGFHPQVLVTTGETF
jgi:hypothetical protein